MTIFAKWNRGLKANLPLFGIDGNWYFCEDTGELFSSVGTALVQVSASLGVYATEAEVTVAIAVETARAEAAEALLASSAALSTEISRAESAETVLTGSIAAETIRAEVAESAAESAAIATAETFATSAVSTEATARAAADTTLATNLAAEVTRAEASEATKAAASALTTETARAETAESTLSTGVAAEVTRAEGAESTIATNLAAEIARAEAAEALRAPLVSPAFTGTPTAPTTSPLDNSTNVATTAYADAAIQALRANALLIQALNAPLASPALTGTPTAPTAATLDNSTKIATTAFVDAEIATSAPGLAPVQSVAGKTGTVTLVEGDIANLTTDLAATEKAANKGSNNGYAGLDSGGHVPLSQLPASVVGALEYQGTWDANANSPALASSVGSKGFFYKIAVAGNTVLDGNTNWHLGDLVLFDGSTWDKVDNYESVTSVAGRAGAIVLGESDITNLTTDLAAKAPLASPALTGSPIAPTAAALDNSTKIATTAYADSAVGVEKTRALAAEALLAPVASPALTGTPTAPTKTALNNSTSLATTAYTDAAVSVANTRALAAEGLLASSASVVTAIAVETARAEAAEASLAPLASPALTGNPTAPTQAALNNSTRVGTTAYSDSAVAAEATLRTAADALKAPLLSPALTGTATAVKLNASKSITTGLSALGNVSGAALSLDLSLGNVISMTLTGNVTSSSFANAVASAGQEITLIITQDATGARTFAWPSAVLGKVPAVAPFANSVSVFKAVIDGSGNANFIGNGPVVAASRVLIGQSTVDGSTGAATLYTVPVGGAGVYRIEMFAVARTLSSSAWQVNVDWVPPTGTHLLAQVGMAVNMVSGVVVSSSLNWPMYLHDGDVLTCGTVTATGSNTGGAFDVSWVIERLI